MLLTNHRVLLTTIVCAVITGMYVLHQNHEPGSMPCALQQKLVTLEPTGNQLKLTTIYGTTTIDEPVLIELLKHPAFERLNHIRQYGVMCHARNNEPEYTRAQHSLGVFFITRMYGAPLSEQIAALLHDVSHTVFSHVGDRLFASNYFIAGNDAYQDNIHEWYLEHTGVLAVLKKYGYGDACGPDAKKHQRCFEQPSPDLCADRIEYNLAGGFIDGMLSRDEVAQILKSLHFKDGIWFFDDAQAAKKFALVSLHLPEQRWGAPWSIFIDQSAADALKRAVELGVITPHDINFSTDDAVWSALTTCTDAEMMKLVHRITHYRECYELTTPGANAMQLRGKFSGTDPLIVTNEGLQRLRRMDDSYSQEFDRVKSILALGWYAKVKDEAMPEHANTNTYVFA